MKISVLGGGSWATAIVKMLLNNADQVGWWMRDESAIDHIKTYNQNPKYLSSVELDPNKLNPSANLSEVVANSDVIILAIPAAFLNDSLKDESEDLFEGKIVFSSIKGIVPESNEIVGEYIHNKFNVDFKNVGVISGPCHAEEVALEKLSYLTVACQNEENAENLAKMISCRYIKTTTSDDIYGTEY